MTLTRLPVLHRLVALGLVCAGICPALFAATTQKTSRHEAENALIVGGYTNYNGQILAQSNASGGSYYDYSSVKGDSIEWTVTAEAGDTAELIFGYASADTGSNRPLEIRVNGVMVGSQAFPNTGGWTTWAKSTTLNVTLNAGTNTIRATAANNIGPNVDYLQVKEILPLSGTIMTVYAGQNLSGTSATVDATHTIYSGATIPGGLDNQISSFVLSTGYMAVVADPADGTNPSKVYIAADGPLTVNALPAGLDNAISFLRVVPWIDTQKKGFCGGNDNYRAKFDHSWYYDWTKGLERGQLATGPEYTPMCWDERFVQINDFLAQDQVTHLLSFNEPDGVNQANMPDITAAVALHKELQKAGLRLGSPACEEQDVYGAGTWLDDFMTQADAQGVRVDYINVHWYDWGSSPGTNTNPDPADVAARFKAKLSGIYKRYRKPIWITEFNANPARPRSVHDGFLQLILPYLDDLAYVERYAYYQWPATTGSTMYFVEPTDNSLTTTGQIYNDHQSPTAYLTTTVPSEWQSADVGVAATGDTLYNGVFTIVGSGTGLSGTADGCRFVYQPISGDVTITAKVTSQIWRNDLSMSGVMIRETLNADSKQATMALSMNQGAKFRTRTTTAASVTAAGNVNIPSFPYWVRLVRQGNSISGYHSADGISWTQLGTTTTISMAASVYIGMAVTSYSDGNFNDAIFKNVTVTQTLGQSLYIDWTRSTLAGSSGNTAQAGDVDGDRLTNLMEYAMGTDPASPRTAALSYVAGGNVTGTGLPMLENTGTVQSPVWRAVFLRRKDHLAAGLTYTVQFSADMTQWTSSAVTPTVLTGAGNPAAVEAVSVPYPATVPANNSTQNLPPKFFRVKVVQP